MEEARRKIRICLLCVVGVAVLTGCIYYYMDQGEGDVNEGTLVRLELTGDYGNAGHLS